LLLQFVTVQAGRSVSALLIDDLRRDTIFAFLGHLETSRGNSVRTRNARLAAIHSFFQFVAAEEPSCVELCRQVLGIPFKKCPSSTFTCLTREDIEHLLASVERTTTAGRRDAALLLFLYNTGARAGEVVSLRLPNLRLDPPTQVRILGKGSKERLCPLWSETVQLIRDTLRDRPVKCDADAPLFLNAAGRPLTRFGLRHVVQSRVRAAASSRPWLARVRITPHTFRHTTALHLLQSGVELNVVRSWLGHASIETTHQYIEIDLEMKRKALETCTAPRQKGRNPSWQEPDLLQWLETL
jgi:site-specific recombinase XerD